MPKFILSFLLLLIPLFAKAEVRPIKIGVIAPMSGPVSIWGQDVKNSLIFASEKLAKGRVEFVFEDDHCLGKDAVTAAHKLIDIDKVDFGVIVCSESMLSAGPIFEQNKKLVFTPTATAAAVSNIGKYSFRTTPSDNGAANTLCSYLIGKVRRLGVITEERGFPVELSSAVRAVCGKDIDIVEMTFQTDETNFKSQMLMLKAKKVDGLFVNVNSENPFVSISKQAREYKLNVPVFGVYVPGYASVLEQYKEQVEGVIYVDVPDAENNLTLEGRKLYSEFVTKYGKLSSLSYVFVSTYELVAILVNNSLNYFEKGTEDLIEQLHKTNYHGIAGDYTFDANGDIQGVSHLLKKIQNGQPVTMKKVGSLIE